MLSKLARLLSKYAPKEESPETNSEPTAGLIVQDANELLVPFKQNIEYIYSSVPVDRNYFDTHYLSAIRALSSYIQAFPASKSDHHNHKFGLLSHSIEVSLFAARLAKKYIYIDDDESSIAELEDRYTYACFTSALFHDAAKILTDISTVYQTGDSDWQVWNPLNGPMPVGAHYRYRYIDDRIYKAHQASAIVLAIKCLQPGSLEWLKSNSRVFQHWCLSLTAHTEAAGEVGKVVASADKISVGNNKVQSPGASNTEAAPTITDKFKQLISKVRHELESSENINHAGNPFFITEHHVILIHPKWTDNLIENSVNARQEQNTMLNILSENENIIKVEGRRALCRFTFTLDSKDHGQINDSVLGAVILKRDVIDSDNKLPTSEIKIKTTSNTSIPDALLYLVDKGNDDDDSGNTKLEVASENSENKSPCEHTSSNNISHTNNKNNECHQNTDIENDSNLFGEADQHEIEVYNSFINSCHSEVPKNEDSTSDNAVSLKGTPLHGNDLEYKSQCDSTSHKYDKTVSKFLLYIKGLATHNNQTNRSNALIHKVDNSIYVVWPEACSRFWKEHRAELTAEFNGLERRNRILEKHILSSRIHSKAARNENFWKIKFRANANAEFGMPIGAIKLSDSISRQSPFNDLPNNKAAMVIMK